jgi:hypothetical protein
MRTVIHQYARDILVKTCSCLFVVEYDVHWGGHWGRGDMNLTWVKLAAYSSFLAKYSSSDLCQRRLCLREINNRVLHWFYTFGKPFIRHKACKISRTRFFHTFFSWKSSFPPNIRSVVCINAEKGVSNRTPWSINWSYNSFSLINDHRDLKGSQNRVLVWILTLGIA